jgi:hypothetical protein
MVLCSGLRLVVLFRYSAGFERFRGHGAAVCWEALACQFPCQLTSASGSLRASSRKSTLGASAWT